MTPIPGPKEHTPEWLALHERYDPERERPVVFGASQAAAACGQSAYRTPLDLFMEYTGRMPPKERPADVQKRLRRGRALQPVVVGEYAHETGRNVDQHERLFFHPSLAFMACSPDGMVWPDTDLLADFNYDRCLEVKTSDPRMFVKSGDDDHKYGQEGTDLVPTDVLFQTQQQMAVMGVPRCDVVVFFGLFVMRIYPVERNETIIEAIVAGEQELADRIVAGNAPEPNWTHPNTKRLLCELHGYRVGESTDLGIEHQEMALANARDKAEIKRLELEIDERNNRMLDALGGAEFGRLPNGRSMKRINIGATEVSYTRAAYSYVREVKGKSK